VPSLLTSRAVPSSLVAGASLLLGFLVAQATGVRVLGGLVLLAGAAWCWVLWRERARTAVAVGLEVAFLAAFVVSHLLARVIGGWPAVLVVAATVALLAYALADSRHPARVTS
jgi:hypothetical protein